MKSFGIALVLLCGFCYAQTPSSLQAQSSGACSPNILSNQGRVEFTCTAAMDKVTANKIVSLLNQILQKQTSPSNEKEVNDKLDQILSFLRNEAQAREPRHFTESQKDELIRALSGTPKQRVNILRTARSAEIEALTDEFIDIFTKAGWRINNNELALAGLEKAVGLGIVVHNQEEHPKAADSLFLMLRNDGFKIEGGANANVPVDEIRLVIAPKQ